MRSYLREIGADCRDLTVSAFRLIREKRGLFSVFALAVAAVAVSTFPHDVNVYHWLTDQRSETVRWAARRVSKWGDYPTGTLILSIGLWVAASSSSAECGVRPVLPACWRRRSRVSRSIRFALSPDGRAEHGSEGRIHRSEFREGVPQFSVRALDHVLRDRDDAVVAMPAIGIPALAGAAAVGWSRMYVRSTT